MLYKGIIPVSYTLSYHENFDSTVIRAEHVTELGQELTDLQWVHNCYKIILEVCI